MKGKKDQRRTDPVWVERRSELKRISEDLQKEESIGVDLEADSLFHYPERVCLLQISPLPGISWWTPWR